MVVVRANQVSKTRAKSSQVLLGPSWVYTMDMEDPTVLLQGLLLSTHSVMQLDSFKVRCMEDPIAREVAQE